MIVERYERTITCDLCGANRTDHKPQRSIQELSHWKIRLKIFVLDTLHVHVDRVYNGVDNDDVWHKVECCPACYPTLVQIYTESLKQPNTLAALKQALEETK